MHVIPYPVCESEFEVQAELYALLKPICDVRGCVPARCSGRKGQTHRVFFDLVVFNPDRKAVLIIECKNSPNNLSLCLNPWTRQARRYGKFGIPVLRCGGREQFDEILNRAELEMEEYMHNRVESVALFGH